MRLIERMDGERDARIAAEADVSGANVKAAAAGGRSHAVERIIESRMYLLQSDHGTP